MGASIDSVMTYIPTYSELRNAVDHYYGSKTARRVSLRARLLLRNVSRLRNDNTEKGFRLSSENSDQGLLPLVRLFVTRSDLFYPLMAGWIDYVKAIHVRENRNNSYSYGRNYSTPIPRHLMQYFSSLFPTAVGLDFVIAIAKALGIPQTIADAITTSHWKLPISSAVLPLYFFHLPLSIESINDASEVFDVYCSRVITSEQLDTLYLYTSDQKHYLLTTALTSSDLNTTSSLSWLIMQSMMELSIEQVVQLVSAGYSPSDVLEVWGAGYDTDVTVSSLLNDIDPAIVSSIYGVPSPRLVEFRPWFDYGNNQKSDYERECVLCR